MTQAQLNRAVAAATGESVNHIEQMGFSLIVVPTRAHPTTERSKARSRPFVSDSRASVSASEPISVQA
jgi:hypothetical protein